ncbi:MAG: DUF2818 family protein [Comamonas sp.]
MTGAAALLLAVAVALANAPFLLRRGRWQALALAAGYGACLLLGRWLEGRLGMVWPQGWAFYAITAAGFAVCGFPGYVGRHLLRRGGERVS